MDQLHEDFTAFDVVFLNSGEFVADVSEGLAAALNDSAGLGSHAVRSQVVGEGLLRVRP